MFCLGKSSGYSKSVSKMQWSGILQAAFWCKQILSAQKYELLLLHELEYRTRIFSETFAVGLHAGRNNFLLLISLFSRNINMNYYQQLFLGEG